MLTPLFPRLFARARRVAKRRPLVNRNPLSAGYRLLLERLESRDLPSTWIGGGFDNICTNHRPTGSDPNAWSNALNWVGGVPGAGDTAVFPARFQITTCGGNPVFAPFSTTANVDQAFSVAALTTDAAWGGSVNVNNPLAIANGFTLASGSLGGAGAMTVGGASQWTGGVLSVGSGGLTNNGTLTLANASQVFLNGNGTLVNAGTIIQSGAGGLNIQSNVANATTLLNQSNATYNFRADASIFSTSGGGTVTNAGTILKTVTTGNSAIQVVFNNSNAINVQTGTVTVQSTGGLNTGGTFTVAGSATLDLTGGRSVAYQGTYVGTGAGTVSLNSGDLVVGDGNATFNFPAGLFQWSGGVITVPTDKQLLNRGVLTLSNPTSVNVFLNGNGTLANAGTIIQSDVGGLNIQSNVANATTLLNQSGATYDFHANASVFSTSGGGTVTNAGTILKSAGTMVSAIQVVLNSSAAVTVQTGTLKLQSTGGLNTGGIFTVTSGATLDLTGGSGVAYKGTYTGSGAGTVALSSGTLFVGGGGATFNFPAGLFQWSGGTINTGAGDLTNAATGILTLSNTGGMFLNGNGTLVNAGTIIQSGAGGLNIQSNVANATTLLNQSNATYNFRTDSGIFSTSGGGTFTNLGTISKTVTAGTSAISVKFNTSAAIDVETGTFQITDSPGLNTGGNFTVARDAVLDLTGGTGVTYSGSYTGSGAGTIALRSGALVVGAAGAAFNFPAGLFQWTGGTISIPSLVQLTNNGTLTLSNASPANVFLNGNGTLVNAGTIIQSGDGGLNIQSNVANATTLLNQATYNFQADGSIVTTSGGGTFTNAGTILKSAGTGTSAIAVVLNSTSAVNVQSGTLALRTTGGTINGGIFTVADSATLDLTGGSGVTYVGTFTGSGAGTVALSSGTLFVGGGGATFNFPDSLFQWSGGVINTNAGNLTNAATGVLTLSNTGQVVLNGNGVLLNAGTIIQSGAGGLNIQSNSANATTLNNQAGAVYNFQADSGILSTSGGGTVINAGTILKTVAAGTSTIQTVLNNSGVIDVETGIVALASSGGVNTGGNFITGDGAILDLTGGVGVTYTGTYTGSGTGTVALSSGTLFVGAGGATFNFPDGLFQWSGGVINTNAGDLTNAATGVLTLSNPGPDNVFLNGNGSLVNAGTIIQSGAGGLNIQSNVANATTLNNQAGALYDIQTDTFIVSTSGGGTVLNFGTFQKSGGSATSTIGLPFTNEDTPDNPNSDLVLALSGTLNFTSSYTQTAGDTNLGGGSLMAGTLNIQGGVLDGAGDVFGSVINAGTVSPGGDGTVGVLTIHGNYTQTATGMLNIDIQDALPGDFDQLIVTGAASLGGTLNVSVLGTVNPGDRFLFLTFASRSGDFAAPPLGFNEVFNTNDLTLVAQ